MDIPKFIFISCKLFERICQRSPNINFLKFFNCKVLCFKTQKKKKTAKILDKKKYIL